MFMFYKLEEVFDMLESRVAIHRNVNKVEEWPWESSWKSAKTNVKSCTWDKATCNNAGWQ